MNPERIIARILKVDHAGEYGAIRIYRAQLAVARVQHAELVPFLEETLAHEIEHCRLFRNAMPRFRARPCRAMWLWSGGGYMLGALTALLGRNAVMLCTAAVERTVHAHMQEQIAFLARHDDALKAMLEKIQLQEWEHLHYAQERCRDSGLFAKILDGLVVYSTELVIWLCTWGDVTRMRRELARAA